MNWDTYFLDIARAVSVRSPDPSTKHGCVLVDKNNRILSTGYNGPIKGLTNSLVSLERPHKYHWMLHAEENAVLFARCSLEGCTAYITGHPCGACFRRLVQAGVRRIVFGSTWSRCITDDELEMVAVVCDDLGVEMIKICDTEEVCRASEPKSATPARTTATLPPLA